MWVGVIQTFCFYAAADSDCRCRLLRTPATVLDPSSVPPCSLELSQPRYRQQTSCSHETPPSRRRCAATGHRHPSLGAHRRRPKRPRATAAVRGSTLAADLHGSAAVAPCRHCLLPPTRAANHLPWVQQPYPSRSPPYHAAGRQIQGALAQPKHSPDITLGRIFVSNHLRPRRVSEV